MITIIQLILYSILSVSTLKTQEKLNLIEKQNYSDDIIGVFSNKSSDELIKVFSNGLIFKDNNKFFFDVNEEYLCNDENYVFTVKSDIKNDNQEIKKYSISNNNLQEIKTLNINTYYKSISPFGNSNIILVSDEYEGYGYKIELYSKDLQLINDYIPFENEFELMEFSSNNKYLALAVNPYPPYNKKLAIFNSKNGKLITDIITDIELNKDNTIVLFIKCLTNQIILFNTNIDDPIEQTIFSYSYNGTYKWKYNLKRPIYRNMVIENNEKNLFAYCTGDDIICINSENVKEEWTINFKDIYKEESINYEIVPMTDWINLVDKDLIVFVLFKIKRITEFIDLRLIVINWDGELIETEKLGNSKSDINLFYLNSKLIIIMDNNDLLIYE